MVKGDRIRTLERGLVQHLKPAMQQHGFRYAANTRTFYRDSGECVHIVNIQPGVRAAEGSFTVTLAVYHPVYHDPAATASALPRE